MCGQYFSSSDTDRRNILQDKCFLSIIGKNTELDQLFEKLFQDCKTDFSVSVNKNKIENFPLSNNIYLKHRFFQMRKEVIYKCFLMDAYIFFKINFG